MSLGIILPADQPQVGARYSGSTGRWIEVEAIVTGRKGKRVGGFIGTGSQRVGYLRWPTVQRWLDGGPLPEPVAV